MPPISPRASRDPRVLATGRQNLRIVVLGVLAVFALMCFFFLRSNARSEKTSSPAAEAVDPRRIAEVEREREAAASSLAEVRADLLRRFDGIDRLEKNPSADQDSALAEIADRLSRIGSSSLRWIERTPATRLFDAEAPSKKRGEFYEMHGTLMGDTWVRPVQGVQVYVGLLRPETELGELSERPIAFISRFLSGGASNGGEAGVWSDGTWVRLQGLYVCDFFVWNRLPGGTGTAPLLVAGELTPSVESVPIRGDFTQEELNRSFEDLDAHFPTRHNGSQYVHEGLPIEVQEDVYLAFAQMAIAHRDEPFDENAEPLFKEMTKRFFEDPQAERGKRFKIQGQVGLAAEVLVGSNPFRFERKQMLFVVGRYGGLWIESPWMYDVKKGELVEIEAYFASRIWYPTHTSMLDRPYFVARALRPFEMKPVAGKEFWSDYLPMFLLASTLLLFAFFFFLLFRDRQRSEEAQARLVEMRRRRRGGRRDEPVAGA